LRKNRLAGAHFASLASFLLAENTNLNPYRSHLQNAKSLVFAIGSEVCRLAKQDDSDDRLGIAHVLSKVEFSTARDGRVCSVCESLEGKIYEVKNAHGIIPVHPNCRCTWLPYVSFPKK
jgi:SPP1 gp7 family putative phage head morphogenesis protein